MPEHENLIIDRDLLFEFFVVFSKFEFALKHSAFLIGDASRAEPNWDGFAASLRNSFQASASSQLKEACEYLLLNPPMKQVVVSGKLAWSSNAPDSLSEAERLLLLVRRVRNNLFHGGKFSAGCFEDTPRQECLLKSTLIILAECLRLSPEVRSYYYDAVI
jgi:hypothetical protein